jgi:hypothetical protein
MNIPEISVKDLHTRLGFSIPLDYPETSLRKPLTEWKMEIDDSPIFRYLYRTFQPHRHLEFGTWQGTGVLYCLEECKATVWTINLLQGEELSDGNWTYNDIFKVFKRLPRWAKKKKENNSTWYQTDSYGFIGRYYIDAGLGYRVCQIYCDSREWDISNYPTGFFDTVLIDGGHQEDVVSSDTNKALQLVRHGGLVMWHDFCPQEEVQKSCSSPQGVKAAIEAMNSELSNQLKDIFWINPSWILLGVKK